MPRCTADDCTSIVPGQFSFGPDFDAELPAARAGALTRDAAPAPVAHIDQQRAASVSMVAMCLNKDSETPGEQPEAA